MNISKLERKCPICGESKGESMYHISMMLPQTFPIQGDYDVIACSKCGFIYADVSGTQENYNEYYEKYNMYSSIASLKKNTYDTACSNRVKFLEKYINKEDKILDIGCGSGDLLKELRKKGFQSLYGIDPSQKSIELLQSEGIEGSVGNIFNEVPEELKEEFDLVCCTAVMEHIFDLPGAIKRISAYIKSGIGRIFLDVPAVEGFEKYKEKLPNYFNHEHINFFSLQSLDNLMISTGFERINDKEESYLLCSSEGSSPELVIQGIYGFSSEKKTWEKDVKSKESVERYFELIEDENHREIQKVKKLFADGKKLIIWGTGALSMWLLQNVPEIKDNISCFIDNNVEKQGSVLCGKKIYGADFLRGKKATILICSMKNSQDIVEQIGKMNLDVEYFVLR